MFEDTHFKFHLPTIVSRFDRGTLLLAGTFISGLALVIYGLTHLLLLSSSTVQAGPGEVLGIASVPESIYIDVSGAVAQPGVYQLQAGDRLATALEKAGGLSVEADNLFVAQTLNLAEKLTDGQKIYIPWLGENESADPELLPSATAISGSISINNASQTELETLPQIGEKRATEIIENRPYGAVTELVDKGVISQTLYEEIKVLISL